MLNPTLAQLHGRKSVRVYEDRPLEPEVRRAILDAAIQAPTAGNMSLFTILDITDPEKKAALAESCDHQLFISAAPMVLIFCADYRRWYDVFCRYVDTVRTPDTGDLFLAQADAMIAAQNSVVAAQSLGVGSCYIGDITEQFEYHRRLLELPQYVVPAAMLCFGYPTAQQRERPKPERFRTEDLVHENRYQMEKSAAMDRMLMAREGREGADFALWLRKFCARKWNSAFSEEMSRSCNAMVDAWREGQG